LLEYCGLGLVLSRSLYNTSHLKKSIIFWIIILFGFIIGMSDEFYQSFVPGRQSSIFDFMADALGVLIGTMIYLRKANHDRN
jgi:VanZ family protein